MGSHDSITPTLSIGGHCGASPVESWYAQTIGVGGKVRPEARRQMYTRVARTHTRRGKYTFPPCAHGVEKRHGEKEPAGLPRFCELILQVSRKSARRRRRGGGAYSVVACLSHFTIDYASLSRRRS